MIARTNEKRSVQDIRSIIRDYFKKSLTYADVYQQGISMYADVKYVDYKSGPTVMRELTEKLPGVHIELERDMSEKLWMAAIDRMDLDDAEVYVMDCTGELNKMPIVSYIMEYMRSNDFA